MDKKCIHWFVLGVIMCMVPKVTELTNAGLHSGTTDDAADSHSNKQQVNLNTSIYDSPAKVILLEDKFR